MARLDAIGTAAALAIAAALGWGEAHDASAPRPTDVELYRASKVVPARATTGWHGGVVTAANGEQVRIEISDGYPPEAVSAQAWADFFAGLVHGSELARVRVRIAPPAEVATECGEQALACYSGGLLVIPGEVFDGTSPEELARHEYGHHVAANRPNPPWRSIDHGPKRWASQARICPRAAAGTVFPDDYTQYALHPGEAFAEAYRVLNERRAGIATLTWSIVDGSFIPNDLALRTVEDDVLRPWAGPATRVVRARFRPNGPARWTLPVATPLDGELRVELRMPAGRLDRLELTTADGRVLTRGLWSGRTTKRLSFLVCGQRALRLRVTRVGTPGRLDLRLTHP